MTSRCSTILMAIASCVSQIATAAAEPPLPPPAISAANKWGDDGTTLTLTIQMPPNQADRDATLSYLIEQGSAYDDLYKSLPDLEVTDADRERGAVFVPISKLTRGQPYWFRVRAKNADGESASVRTAADAPARPEREIFDWNQRWLLVEAFFICGSIVLFIGLARLGWPMVVRKIAGLDAVEEAVGRATEMGRSCLFVPGIQDMNEMQTIAGLTILSRVAEQAAAYDCKLETPTSKSLVMTAARETVENAFLTAGRPQAYNPDDIYYVTDEQFAYVSFLTGKMVREKPAACFYLGSFYAESLILAETGNSIGAIQVAGTAQPSQLPFFVAACDYTLIGEEFFAASAYLSRNPDQLGSLKGQDVGKILVAALVLIGVFSLTLGEVTHIGLFEQIGQYIKDDILSAG